MTLCRVAVHAAVLTVVDESGDTHSLTPMGYPNHECPLEMMTIELDITLCDVIGVAHACRWFGTSSVRSVPDDYSWDAWFVGLNHGGQRSETNILCLLAR